MLEAVLWVNWSGGVWLWPRDGYIWKWTPCQTCKRTILGAFKCLPWNSFLYCRPSSKVLSAPSFHQNWGFWQHLDAPNIFIRCQKWIETPYQNMHFWETLRITILYEGPSFSKLISLLFQSIETCYICKNVIQSGPSLRFCFPCTNLQGISIRYLEIECKSYGFLLNLIPSSFLKNWYASQCVCWFQKLQGGDQAEKLMAALFAGWGNTLSSSPLNPVWMRVLGDPFLRQLTFRYNSFPACIRLMSHPVHSCKSRRLAFHVSESELRCKIYERSKWSFSLSDHIEPPNCFYYWT